MVEEIEELRAELDLLRFTNPEVLLQDQVEVNEMRTAEIPNFGIAKAVHRLLPRRQRGCNKRRLVVPAIERLMSGVRARKVGTLRRGVEGEVVRVGNLIRTITEASGIAQVGG